MHYVYALSSERRRYIYIGMTGDFDARLERHQNGYERTTKPHRPFKIVFLCRLSSRELARCVEKYFKSGVGREFLRELESVGLSGDR